MLEGILGLSLIWMCFQLVTKKKTPVNEKEKSVDVEGLLGELKRAQRLNPLLDLSGLNKVARKIQLMESKASRGPRAKRELGKVTSNFGEDCKKILSEVYDLREEARNLEATRLKNREMILKSEFAHNYRKMPWLKVYYDL